MTIMAAAIVGALSREQTTPEQFGNDMSSPALLTASNFCTGEPRNGRDSNSGSSLGLRATEGKLQRHALKSRLSAAGEPLSLVHQNAAIKACKARP